jgi:hypothetical protein
MDFRESQAPQTSIDPTWSVGLWTLADQYRHPARKIERGPLVALHLLMPTDQEVVGSNPIERTIERAIERALSSAHR